MTDHNDVSVPVEAAMRVFWRDGIERGGYAELVTATGLARRALYARWPDKHALVLDTLAHYRATVLSALIGVLDTWGEGTIDSFWNALGAAMRTEGWNGCYLVRTATGPMGADPRVRAILRQYLADLSGAFQRALTAAGHPDPRLAAAQAIAVLIELSALGAALGHGPEAEAALATGRATTAC